jgi:hypothetical protein
MDTLFLLTERFIMNYISNSFSLQMQGENDCVTRRVTLDDAKNLLCSLVPGPYIDRESEKDGSDAVVALVAQSCVGHADIASVLSVLIGVNVPVNRVSVSLQPGDQLVVGQYVGPRLPEGCKELPKESRIEWYVVLCRAAGAVAELEEIRNDLANAAANFEWPEEGEKLLRATVEKHFPQYFNENAFD